jgi:urease accessory protein
MKAQFLRQHLHRVVALALLGGLATAAQAHPGHGAGLMAGLMHPLFGPDHLLAMVAVGIWSASALPANKAWQGPATFMLALAIGAALGMTGVTVPYLEHMVALSVVLFGAMLLLARRTMPAAAGLGLIAAAAALHGLAHGAEAPAQGLAGYAVGFMVTTAALHVAGLGLGLSIRRRLAERSGLALGGLGAALGVAGIYLFGQLAA